MHDRLVVLIGSRHGATTHAGHAGQRYGHGSARAGGHGNDYPVGAQGRAAVHQRLAGHRAQQRLCRWRCLRRRAGGNSWRGIHLIDRRLEFRPVCVLDLELTASGTRKDRAAIGAAGSAFRLARIYATYLALGHGPAVLADCCGGRGGLWPAWPGAVTRPYGRCDRLRLYCLRT